MKILVTGGTGHLGRAIVARLMNGGHHVRVLARRPGNDPRVEWAQADLGADPDLAAPVAGVDAIVHAATNSPAARRGGFRPLDFIRSPNDVDIDGTNLDGERRCYKRTREREAGIWHVAEGAHATCQPVHRRRGRVSRRLQLPHAPRVLSALLRLRPESRRV